MTNATNLKERIHSGEVIFGVGAPVYFNRTQLEDLMAKGDYSLLCGQSAHGFLRNDLENCGHAEALGVPGSFASTHHHTYRSDASSTWGPTGIWCRK